MKWNWNEKVIYSLSHCSLAHPSIVLPHWNTFFSNRPRMTVPRFGYIVPYPCMNPASISPRYKSPSLNRTAPLPCGIVLPSTWITEPQYVTSFPFTHVGKWRTRSDDEAAAEVAEVSWGSFFDTVLVVESSSFCFWPLLLSPSFARCETLRLAFR